MAEKKEEDKRSTRTKKLDEEYEKTKSPFMNLGRGLSRLGDAVGFTQEEEYKDKTKEELAKKKRAGGAIKRYQQGGYAEPNYAFNNQPSYANNEPQTSAPGGVTTTERQPMLNTNLLNIGPQPEQMRKGGRVKKKSETKTYKSGGKVSSASKRGDGCAQRGKTKGRMI
jgi:hypothetical protein